MAMTPNEKDFFIESTLSICRQLEIEAVLFNCLNTINRIMPADGLYLQYYDEGFNGLRVVAKATKEGGSQMDELVHLTAEGKEIITAVISLAGGGDLPDTMIYNRPETDPICCSMLALHEAADDESSLMVLLLGIKETLFGSVALHTYGHDRFSQEHARYFSLLREPLAVAVSNARKHREVIRMKDLLADDNRYLQKEMHRLSGDQIIGKESGLKPVMHMVDYVAVHDSPVLILGETGVGKDVIANAIHDRSLRSGGPFIAVNCGAIPDSLLDSELFGHEKGAFTGALAQKRGRFERAENGTIFLDEIGELTPDAQVRLLRVIQNHKIERVGGIKTIAVDIRVIAATNQNLEQLVFSKRFREDLWFRLNVFPIIVPPLRARKSDIPALVDYFLKKKAQSLKLRSVPDLAEGALEPMFTYHWPGNVRELENVVERALILNRSDSVRFDIPGLRSLQVAPVESDQPEPDLPSFRRYQADYFKKVLAICDGRINGSKGAARLTGLNPSTLRNKLKKLGVPFGTGKQHSVS